MTNESLAGATALPVAVRDLATDARPASRSWPTFGASTVIGAAVCVAAVLVGVGARAPWYSFSLFSLTAKIGGLNSHLDGRYALALGGLGFILGVLVAVLPRNVAALRVLAAALVLLGVGGVYMIWHQYIQLSNNATVAGRNSGLTPFAKYFDVHAGAVWGLWLTGGAFAAFAVAGVLTAIVARKQR